jgi:hypothetical protein
VGSVVIRPLSCAELIVTVVKMKLLQMCWKIKSEEETLLKNQILSENSNIKQADTMKTFKFMFFHGMKNLTEPKSPKLLNLIDQNSKSKDWFVPKLARRESEEYLEKEPCGSFVVRIGRNKQYFALSLICEDCEYHHYKIMQAQDGWTLLGCQKTFLSLSSLVIHLSILKEVLPVTLRRDW